MATHHANTLDSGHRGAWWLGAVLVALAALIIYMIAMIGHPTAT